jgi:hypothetical protein
MLLRMLGASALALTLVAASPAPEGSTTASAADTAARAANRPAPYWFVVVSGRDGEDRGYSVRPDGTRLTPLLPATRALAPSRISRDGSTLAYNDLYDRYGGGILVSRANGTRLRPIVRDGLLGALSADGKMLAFSYGDPTRIAVIRNDGRGRRDVPSENEEDVLGWSPDGTALLVQGYPEGMVTVAVQRLSGARRELARGRGVSGADWSPDGRWIAYELTSGGPPGLYLVRPNGTGRHRVYRGSISRHSWSPDGRLLAIFNDLSRRVLIIGVDGRRRRVVVLPREDPGKQLEAIRVTATWTPDGRLVVFRPRAAGDFFVLGWTRLGPVRAPAGPLLPGERVADAHTVVTRRPISGLSADGSRVALAVATRTAVDCDHVVVWAPASRALRRFGPPRPCKRYNNAGEIYDVELAGSRAAWAAYESCGNYCDVSLRSATLAASRPVMLSYLTGAVGSSDGPFEYHVRGHGDMLAFNDGERLVRIGGGREKCAERSEFTSAEICTRIRRGAHACCAESVGGGLIAVREPDAVAVVDARGEVVHVFPFGRGQVSAARLDGARLVVARARVLEVYDARTGAAQLQRPLPSGFTLTDVDGGIAVLQNGATVVLLRLADGRSFTLRRGLEPVSAELEPSGLYHAYALADRTGRAVFVPRAEVLRRLQDSAS